MAQGSHGPAQPQTPRDPRLKEGWRAAAAAYRHAYGEPSDPNRGHADKCYDAAMKEAVSGITDREAMLEAVAAVSYASQAHPRWLYALHKPAPRERR